MNINLVHNEYMLNYIYIYLPYVKNYYNDSAHELGD